MKLELINDENLTPELFERHPVWAEYHEPADAKRMVDDGFSKEEVESELNRIRYSDAYLIPVVSYKGKSPYEFTHYRAKASIGNKKGFDAYLFAINGEINTYGIYDGDEWQVINFSFLDIDEEMEIKAALGVESLFPLHIEAFGNIEYAKTYASKPKNS
ncbi:hypothetical protein [Motilimonas eburnea]|uniref:hypothetical protein n=1 Tax=Motilimonas eburnea TaxID=1737488 RepID=UPI001E5054CD|nr:hypothetical protein [Motilimonas eburnea]MCE2573361.1 hypothetical protein [Motilimonas eburnea]